jgi:hypothetical protein
MSTERKNSLKRDQALNDSISRQLGKDPAAETHQNLFSSARN